MAPGRSIRILCLFSILVMAIAVSNLQSESEPSIYDLLSKYGLPKGLLPNNVDSYSLSPDGSFRVQLRSTCYVQFDGRLVYYDKLITGKLTYGSVSDVSGIQAQKLFLWLPVTGIKLNQDSNTVQFYVGPLSEQLPANQFDQIPSCRRQPCKANGSRPLALAM